MTVLAEEIEEVMKSLPPARAEEFSGKVRGLISEALREEEPEWLGEVKRKLPDMAHLIGSWRDIDFEVAEDLPPSPDE